MSKALLVLLGRERDKKLAIALHDLETAASLQTIDAKLIGDILHKGHMILRDMQLEPDATAKELYQALRVHDDILSSETDYVGLCVNGEVVSFHSRDIAADEAEMRQFADRSLVNFRTALTKEIARRYRPHVTRPRVLEAFEQCSKYKEKV